MDGSVAEGALWCRGRGGDAAAFGLIFDLHRDRVFRHSLRILQNHDDAEDACGVAFLELGEHVQAELLAEDLACDSSAYARALLVQGWADDGRTQHPRR
jgi:hypothetical protein